MPIAVHRGLARQRVVLISGPMSLISVIERWARHQGITESKIPTSVQPVRHRVGEPIEKLELAHLAANLRNPALIVHDRSDEDIPIEDGLAVASAWPDAKLLITERYGHRRILIAKNVVRQVVNFLKA